ncbi:MAG: hypothetical protein CL947_04180 [Epsilonproteobacteria bacterium]|nr:hypothetical protein [Campylobacterota bacterium]|tara:strand:+ start:1426 stop:1992 length:567 start_codon:yes stop_codon:yes gene_type:complete
MNSFKLALLLHLLLIHGINASDKSSEPLPHEQVVKKENDIPDKKYGNDISLESSKSTSEKKSCCSLDCNVCPPFKHTKVYCKVRYQDNDDQECNPCKLVSQCFSLMDMELCRTLDSEEDENLCMPGAMCGSFCYCLANIAECLPACCRFCALQHHRIKKHVGEGFDQSGRYNCVMAQYFELAKNKNSE